MRLGRATVVATPQYYITLGKFKLLILFFPEIPHSAR